MSNYSATEIVENNPHIQPLVLSRYEAAAALRISTITLDKLLKSGKLKSIKLGDRRLIPIADLNQFLAEAHGKT